MPRYYFDIRDGNGAYRDASGEDFDSFEEACDQAQALLPDLAREELPDGETHDFVCEVRNESGRIVYRARLMLRAERVDEPSV